MNQRFLEVIQREKPDYLFVQLIYDEFLIETLSRIRSIAPDCKVINFCGDDDSLFFNYSVLFLDYINYYFITQPAYIRNYEKYGKKAYLMLGYL